MKRITVLAAGALVAALLSPAVAEAGGTASVTIVHAATYDYPGAPFTVTLCVDDVVVDDSLSVGDILGPLDAPAGPHVVEITLGADAGCDAPTISEELTFSAGDDVTVAAIWTSETEGAALVVWPNDTTCIEAGSARLTVRHGAWTYEPVDVVGVVDGAATTIVRDLGEGEQASVEVPGGTLAEDVEVSEGGIGGDLYFTIGDLGFDEGMEYVVYAVGGADGSAGFFMDQVERACSTPTTTAPTTTTTRAAAAETQPRFTG